METTFIFFATSVSAIMCMWWNKNSLLNMAIKMTFGAQAFMGGYLIYTMRLLGG